jgi:hypothetical protein
MSGKLARALSLPGLAALFGTIGYVVGDDLGLFIGICLGLIPVLGWRFLRHRDELRVTFLKVHGYRGENPVPVSQVGPASRAMVWSMLAGALFFLLYSVVIAVAHNSRIIAGLISALQPAADWLALFVPAFDRMATELAEKGLANWIAATRHVLLVGWLYILVATVWIVSDMLIIHRRDWGRVGFIARSPEPVKTTLAVCAFLAMMLAFIFFGVPASHLRIDFDAGFQLPIFALFFVMIGFIVWVLAMWWSARLFRAYEREEDRQQQQLIQEMQGVLRDALRGKPHKH